MINGASNAEIAAEYDFDDYTVSYYRVELYKHYKVR
jgi:DNA-binding NarL/FixJ family response regulator